MQIQITFDTSANRNAFAAKTGYPAADQVTLDCHPALLAIAKDSAGFSSAAQIGSDSVDVIVKCPVVVADAEALGNDFYVLSTTNFVETFDLYGGAEVVDAPIKLFSELSGQDVIDPLSADAQWARIRIAARYRPFPDSFLRANTTPHRKPELIVIDSGINFSHPEFAGLETENFYKLDKLASFNDIGGHGTGVASAAVGQNVGVANHVKLVSVKVFDPQVKPTLLELGQTMDAILARHVADPTTARVVNMSWNTPKSAFLEGKLSALADAGIILVAAAGNDGIDVAGLTPAGMAKVITVAASDKDDVAAGFNDFAAADASITTNAGQFLDMFAPGVDVTLAKAAGGYFKVSGTSASAGYVSGCVASQLGLWPSWPQTPYAVLQALVINSTQGVLLLDTDKFSPNQNRIVHLPDGLGSDHTAFDYYLGVFDENTTVIEGDISQHADPIILDDQSVEYQVVWDDPALEAAYGQFVTVDPATGLYSVTKPTGVDLPSDVNLKLVRFRITGTTSSMQRVTSGLIFFHVNPNYDGDVSVEVASALEDLNSQSFFAAWGGGSLK